VLEEEILSKKTTVLRATSHLPTTIKNVKQKQNTTLQMKKTLKPSTKPLTSELKNTELLLLPLMKTQESLIPSSDKKWQK
jgi:hypothetical protein